MENTTDYWIQRLGLTPHPEGGYFNQTYCSPESLPAACLPARYTTERVFAKGIYFLLPGNQVSKFHRLKCEEIWCHHVGAALTISMIHQNGTRQQLQLGPNPEAGEHLHVIIPPGVWFGAQVKHQDAFALVTCITIPGFEFADFELAERESLLRDYPQHRQLIEILT
ncbi:hypothetical protein GF339_08245 [candidate division KSB3 bacterium]|uniref:DUF985 domain-containing protein n=1 Tax=candidate division KSB3 bacterium TaxID=2044937 RepID=A0A9D5JV98_9BACT|nr:hypothetical protein [candidate division KSB3 bacterium]MBD3324561.1 hypothetical protein [candidate division KSB3 bacterium]